MDALFVKQNKGKTITTPGKVTAAINILKEFQTTEYISPEDMTFITDMFEGDEENEHEGQLRSE